MIRHAPPAAFPVIPLPVAVIEPPLPALLVPPVGVPPLLPPLFFAGIAPRNTGGPGHNDGRSRTPRHSRTHGKSVGVGARRGPPAPPLRREGTTASPSGQSRSHLQMTLGRFFGTVQKTPTAG